MKTIVVVIDMQNDYCHPEGFIGKSLGVQRVHTMLPRMQTFLQQMRRKQVPVVHFRMTEHVNHIAPNLIPQRRAAFGDEENWSFAEPGTWGHALVLAPAENEMVFEKNTYDIFSNKEFHSYLIEEKIEKIVVVGGYTHACVETSVRSGTTHGFDMVVVADLVGSPDALQHAHEQSLRILGTLFATIVPSSVFIEEERS